MNERTREYFDGQLEWVLERLPPQVHELLEQVPLHVEDYPSRRVMEEMEAEYRDELCGLYDGIPLSERSVMDPATRPDVITIYREGILSLARGRGGHIGTGRLRRQIRITVLHELAHYHGLTEDELRELGYE